MFNSAGICVKGYPLFPSGNTNASVLGWIALNGECYIKNLQVEASLSLQVSY